MLKLSLLGDRLTVGQQTLNLLIVVRIHVPQPRNTETIEKEMKKIKKDLEKLGLSSENSVVIGSGILNALGIRESNDIDAVVSEETFEVLKSKNELTLDASKGEALLTNDLFEIWTEWEVLGKKYKFSDLSAESTIVDGVRYNSLDFLFRVKNNWVKDGSAREKDKRDVELINNFLKNGK